MDGPAKRVDEIIRRRQASRQDAQSDPESERKQSAFGTHSSLPDSASPSAARKRTHLDRLAPLQALQHLLKPLPVDRLRMVKVELAIERELELGGVVPLVERVLREDQDVRDVI